MKKFLVFSLLLMLATGVAVAETTYSKALEEKAIKGDADAMLELSTCYRFAMGVTKNLDWANYWLECAAKAGSTKALTVLTSLGDVVTGLSDAKRRELDSKVQKERQKLDDNSTTIDYSTYNDALVRRAQGGEAKAQKILGDCYFFSKGVTQNYNQAAYWWRKAAEQDYTEAQFNTGWCYEKGNGVTQDYSQAVYWYRKAADKNYASAQGNLGICYEYGYGVTKDYYQAVYWYRKAAEQGNKNAQNCLGECYYNGEGVSKDYYQAIYWFRKSANQDYPTAQAWMGYCYEKGYGTSIDMSTAVEWYRKAAKQGNEFSQKALTRLGYSW